MTCGARLAIGLFMRKRYPLFRVVVLPPIEPRQWEEFLSLPIPAVNFTGLAIRGGLS